MTKGAFENLELPDDFEPMGIFMEGKKDKDGSALVSSTDILEGKAEVKKALKKHNYPPEGAEYETETILKQAALFAQEELTK